MSGVGGGLQGVRGVLQGGGKEETLRSATGMIAARPK